MLILEPTCLQALDSKRRLVGAVGIESTNCMETKEFCGATWPSKVLERKERNSYCPLNAPKEIHSEFRGPLLQLEFLVDLHGIK